MKTHHCPACNSIDSLRRSKVRSWDKPFGLFGMHPLRCKECFKRFHRRWNIPAQTLTQMVMAPAVPVLRNDAVAVAPPSLSTPPAFPVGLARVIPPPKVEAKVKVPARRSADVSPALLYSLLSFGVLLLLHFVVGAMEYSTLGKAAMWVNLLSLLTVTGGLLVFIHLERTRCVSFAALGVTVVLVLRWLCLFFVTEFVYGFLLGPGGNGVQASLALYREQFPWMWGTYAVLPVSGVLGCSAYLLFRNRTQ